MNTTLPSTDHDDARELSKLAADIDTYRADLGMPKAAFLRQYAKLGSDKTFNKLVTGDTSQLDVSSWLVDYRGVWAKLMQEDVWQETALLQLTGAAELCANFLTTFKRRDNSRFGLVLGENGVGKTSAVEVLKSKSYAAGLLDVQALAIWKNERTNDGTAAPLLKAIGKAMGLVGLPSRKGPLMEELIEKLGQARRYIVIEEAHHLCPQGLATIKNLINLTPTTIIATAIPKLWEQLAGSKEAYREAKQLIGNRLAFVVYIKPEAADVEALLLSSGVQLSDTPPEKGKLSDLKSAIGTVMGNMSRHGHMKFVKNVILRFQRGISRGETGDLDAWEKAVTATSEELTPGAKRK